MNQITEHLKRTWLMHNGITFVLGALLVIGLIFVYSACYIDEEVGAHTQFWRQAGWTAIGIMVYLGFASFDYRNFEKVSWMFYAGCLVLLVLVLFAGKKVYGARRWLMIFGLGIQPSELAKFSVILLSASMLARSPENNLDLKTIGIVGAVMAVPAVLILRQPDLGTAALFAPVIFIMLFAAGMPVRYVAIVIGIGAACVLLVLGAVFLPERLGLSDETQQRIENIIRLHDHQKKRILVFLDPDLDPRGAGWNKMQSEIAVGSGGVWGKGFLKGTQNLYGYLPRSISPTDFIFSVIAEEKGFVGSVVVLGLFSLLISFGLTVAFHAPDRLGRMLCVGAMALTFSHVLINIAMTVGLLPIVGIPLPFLSYGGTFMVVMMAAMGVVQSVYISSSRV